MTDNFIQAPPDAGGKRADTKELVNSQGVTVHRLRMEVPHQVRTTGDLLELLLAEMRRTNLLLAQALGIDDMTEEQAEGD